MENRALGRYQIRAELGRGMMGIVYRAYDPVLEREVALKTVELAPGVEKDRREKFLERFRKEAKIAARLLHPNIVVTHDASTDESTGVPFIAMELVSGGSLAERVRTRGRLPWREAAELVLPLARALDYAHREGVVHRDIKPANVLLSRDGVPKVADFGIARLPTSDLTQTGALLGTPYFMSPEQLEADEVDGRSDLFSLGSLFYTLLSGEPPFRGDDIATITHQVLYKSPAPVSESRSDVPEAVDGVVARTLAKRPDERYQTGAELASDLERLLRGESPARALSFGEKTVESVARPAPAAAPAPPAESEPLLELEPERSSGWGRALVLLVLGAALAIGALTRWDAVSATLGTVTAGLKEKAVELEGTLRESREELERRAKLESAARERLQVARAGLREAHWTEAGAAVEESLRLAREASDGEGEAEALVLRGLLHAESGAWSEARADLDAAASVFEIYGDAAGRARALAELADLERDLGELDRAEALYDRAASGGAGAHIELGRAVATLMRGNVETARNALWSVAESRGAESSARASLYLAALAAQETRHDEVDRLLSRAEGALPPAEASLWRGYAALVRGDDDEARRLFGETAKQCLRNGNDPARAAALEGLELLGAEDDQRPPLTLLLAEPRTARSASRRALLTDRAGS